MFMFNAGATARPFYLRASFQCGRRPLIKGYFAALRLIVGAVMSSACLVRVMTPVGADGVR
jgi:hypothetical protein